MSKYNKVMLLYGGVSAEREISIITSKEISRALVRLGYEVIEIDADLDLSDHISEHKPDVIFNGLHGTWGEDGEVWINIGCLFCHLGKPDHWGKVC